MGGSRATSDLAQGLGTTFAAAERMKTLHGAVGLTDVGALEMVEAPRLGPDGRLEAHQCSRADIAQVLRPRIEEILELMDGRLSKASAAGRPLPRRIVLTGGSSQLPVPARAGRGRFPRSGASRQARECEGIRRDVQFPRLSPLRAGLLRWELMGGPDPSRGARDRARGRSRGRAWSSALSAGFRKISEAVPTLLRRA